MRRSPSDPRRGGSRQSLPGVLLVVQTMQGHRSQVLYGPLECGLNNHPFGPHHPSKPLDGSPDRVALFLSQVISHFDLYGRFYPSQWAMVVAITTVLTGEAADWVVDLHSEHARELTNVGMFLEDLRGRFEDESRAQSAEGEILALKQRGQSAKEYVKEFRKISGLLRAWPECLLIHLFHMGLDRELRQACVYRGLPPRLTEWFKVAVELDVDLQEFRS